MKFNVALSVVATSSHKRAYTIKVEAKHSGSSVWVPVDSMVNHNSAAIDEYQDLGGGKAAWLEDAETDLSFAVVASITPAPQQYKITIAKPDIALMKRPERVDTADESTRGNVKLKLKFRNSSDDDSSDSLHRVLLYCVDPLTDGAGASWAHGFSFLRTSGESNFIDGNDGKEFELTTVCQGVGNPGNSPLYVRLNADYDLTNKRYRHPQTASSTFTWPFSATANTLWSRQSQLTGGVQIKAESSDICTSSLTLGLIPPTPTPVAAVSTTAHCADDEGYTWRQGSIPLVSGSPSSVSIGATTMRPTPVVVPTPIPCQPVIGSTDKCFRGEQAYAATVTTVTTADGDIFRPVSENTSTRATLSGLLPLKITHFESSGSRFRVVASSPPDNIGANVRFHKVGRTTGWTSGEAVPMGPNATERSDCLRNDSDIDRSDDDSHWECVASAAYLSKGGDSGSPVFVRRGSGNDVVLVGVHVRNRPDPTAAGFIPIDRIYAESLAQGYDWNPVQLRPVPVLDRELLTQQGAESLEVDDNDVITATFEARDFTPRMALTYKAALFREGTKVDVPEVPLASFTDSTVRVGNEDVPVKRADFDIAAVTEAEGTGTFTVAVRACTDGTPSKCGGYGSPGTISLLVE